MAQNTKKYDEKVEILEQFDFFPDDHLEVGVSKFACHVGEFMIRFSIIEHDLNIAISEALNSRSHDIGLNVIAPLSLRNKLDLFRRLYLPIVSTNNKKQLPGVTQKVVLATLYQELGDLIGFRNRIAHANWATIDRNGFVRSKITADDNGFVQFVRFKVSIKLLNERIKQISSLDLDMNEFYKIALGL